MKSRMMDEIDEVAELSDAELITRIVSGQYTTLEIREVARRYELLRTQGLSTANKLARLTKCAADMRAEYKMLRREPSALLAVIDYILAED